MKLSVYNMLRQQDQEYITSIEPTLENSDAITLILAHSRVDEEEDEEVRPF